MSRITAYEEVTYKSRNLVIKSVTCDGCGKTEEGLPESWHEFPGRHDGWGYDSMDSYVYYHACSAECYLKALGKAVERFNKYKTIAEIDGFSLSFAKKVSELIVKGECYEISEAN